MRGADWGALSFSENGGLVSIRAVGPQLQALTAIRGGRAVTWCEQPCSLRMPSHCRGSYCVRPVQLCPAMTLPGPLLRGRA